MSGIQCKLNSECLNGHQVNAWPLSVQFSCSVVSDSLRPHESQHARPPCPSPASGIHSDSWPSSQWYHPAISSSVIPFSSCPKSLPASGSFPMSQLFTRGGQSIGLDFACPRLLCGALPVLWLLEGSLFCVLLVVWRGPHSRPPWGRQST